MKVSICLITYNHEQYITEALDSLISQITSFDKEIIIGEDFSTDQTRNICQHYVNRYPEMIKLVPAERNIGMLKNFHRNLKECTGEYVAFIEGDDYWTDIYKLQKQVDFLEANKEYSACFHNVIMKEERNGENREWILHESLPKDSFDTEDILGPWFIPSPSFVFRNYADLDLPEWFFTCKYGDLPFMLLLSLKGNIKYINEVMGVYRKHDNGAATNDIEYDKIILMIYIYGIFNVHTNYKYQETIRKTCIYEIDRHVPKKEVRIEKKDVDKKGIFVKGYKKIKRLIGAVEK